MYKDNTLSNLIASFGEESMMYCKYIIYSELAGKIGNNQLAQELSELANQEKSHAKILLSKLVDIDDIKEGLSDCMQDEKFQHEEMYENFSKLAKENGDNDISELFINLADIEKNHFQKCKSILYSIDNNNIIEENKMYKCKNCGYSYMGKAGKKICPMCGQ